MKQLQHDHTEEEADCSAVVSPLSPAAAAAATATPEKDTAGDHNRDLQEDVNRIHRGSPGRERGTTRVIMCVHTPHTT